MTLWVLIFVCINGAQGCTYSNDPLIIGSPGDPDSVTAYTTFESCDKDAKEFTARYGDPGIYEVCRRVPGGAGGKQP
jgi:hypothetical protein